MNYDELIDDMDNIKTKDIAICEHCDEQFEKNTHNQKYCPECADIVRRQRIKEKTKLKRKFITIKSYTEYLVNANYFSGDALTAKVLIFKDNISTKVTFSQIKSKFGDYWEWFNKKHEGV